MELLTYVLGEPETRVLAFLAGWALGLLCGALISEAVTR